MFVQKNIGILGIGTYLPDDVRSNDWWPRAAVSEWPAKMSRLLSRARTQPEFPITEGVRLSLEALERNGKEPFFGVRERRVMPQNLVPSDMEERASRDALTRANVTPQELDFILVHSMVPDHQTVNGATIVHHKLGAAPNCYCLAVDSVCNSFVSQISLASALIASGQANVGLIVQSSAVSRILDPNEPWSAWVGDGATAVVVGRAAKGHGVLSVKHRVSSADCVGLVTGTEGRKAWYDEGRAMSYIADSAAARRTVLQIADLGSEVLGEALHAAGISGSEVKFFAGHQNCADLRAVTQELAGMGAAKSNDTFAWTASLSSANIPFQLAIASREGSLTHGDHVAAFSMGSGTTAGAVVLRWESR